MFLYDADINEDNCSYAIIFPSSVPLNIVKIFELLIAFITLPLIMWNVKRFYKNRGTLHVNFLIAYTNAFIFYAIHSTAIFSFHTTKMIKYYTYSSACELFTIKWACDTYKCLCYLCLIGFTLSHAAMCVERALATFQAKNYEKKGAKYGILLTIFIWSFSVGTNFVVDTTSSGPYQMGNRFVDYCISMGSSQGATIVHWVLLWIDLLSTTFDIFLFKINRIEGKNKIMNYDLSKRFQIVENFSTIQTMIPVVATHSAIYTFYLICALCVRIKRPNDETFYRALYEAVYTIISIYILAMMLVLLKAPIGKKKYEAIIIHPKTNEKDVYFKLFQNQLGVLTNLSPKAKIQVKLSGK